MAANGAWPDEEAGKRGGVSFDNVEEKATEWASVDNDDREHAGDPPGGVVDASLKEQLKPHPRKTRLNLPGKQEDLSLSKASKKAANATLKKKDNSNRWEDGHYWEAWQYYMRRRPLQDETNGIPLGFKTEQDARGNTTVMVAGDQGKPITTWTSLSQVRLRDFMPLGPGLVATFRFMMFGGWFFLAVFVCNLPAMVLQSLDPTDSKWLGSSLYADIVFMFIFCIFMVYLRYDTEQIKVQVERESVTTSCFAVMVENVPEDATADEMAAYFEQWGQLYHSAGASANLFDNDFDRTGVSMTFNNPEMIRVGFDLVESIERRKSTDPNQVNTPQKSCGCCTGKSMIEKEEDLIKKLDNLRSKHYKVSGPCFVVFEQSDSRDACLEAFGHGVQNKDTDADGHVLDVFGSAFGSVAKRMGLSEKEKDPKEPTTEDPEEQEALKKDKEYQEMLDRRKNRHATMKSIGMFSDLLTKVQTNTETARAFRPEGVHLRVSPAPDPTDILWTNIGTPHCEVVWRRIVAWTLSTLYILLVIACIVFLCGVHRWSQVNQEVGLLTFLPGILTIGNAATLGAAALLATNVLFVQPAITLFEKLPTRTELEKITFVKCGVFQSLAVFCAAIIVYGLHAWEGDLGDFITLILQFKLPWGSNLPSLKDCPQRYTADDRIYLAMASGRGFSELDEGRIVSPQDLVGNNCLAYTTFVFGQGISTFLTAQLVADIALINTIDLICPNWWVNTKLEVSKKFYQRDLNLLFEGVDFHPYLRYQVLMKFLFLGLIMPPIEYPRVMYAWTAICFFQCYYIERYCFVKRYRHQPLYDTTFINVIIYDCMPAGLIIHIFSSIFVFCFTYSRDNTLGNDSTLEITANASAMVSSFVFYLILIVFLVVWWLPLNLWNTFSQGDTFSHGTDLKRIIAADPVMSQDINVEHLNMKFPKLSYTEALNATRDHHLGKVNLLNGVSIIEVTKYIPFPKRREYGIAFQLRG